MARALIVSILGDAKQFGAELDKAAGKTRSLGKAAGVAGLAIAGGLAIGLEKSVKEAVAGQAATARLDQAFKQSGESATKYAGAISGAEDAGRKLGFTNLETRDSLGSLEIATHDHTKAIKDLAVAEDVARFKHVDLASASKMLSMAMAGSQRAAKQLGITVPAVTTHYDALKRSGMDLTTVQGKQAEAAAKLQDRNATIAKVIGLVTEKTHGQAKAFSDTAAGGMAQMHAQIAAIGENLGTALLPALTKVTSKIADLAGWLAKHSTVAKIAVIALGALAASLLVLSVATTIAAAAATAFALPVLAVVAALAILGIAIYEIVQHWGTISAFFSGVWEKIKGVFNAGIDFVKTHWRAFVVALATIIAGPIGALVALIATHWGQIKEKFTSGISAVVGFMKALPGKIVAAVGNVGSLLVNKGGDIIDSMKSGISKGFNALGAFVRSIPGKIVGALGDLSKLLYSAGTSIIKGLWDGIKSELSGLLSDVKGIGGKIASLKGPLDADKVLLMPHGRAIIEGLQAGMEGALPDLYGAISGIAPQIQVGAASSGATPAATGASRGGAGNVYVTVQGWVGSDQQLAQRLRNELVRLGRTEPNIFAGYA